MDKDFFFDKILGSVLETKVRFSVLKIDCGVVPGFPLSNANILCSVAMGQQGMAKSVDFWYIFNRAKEIFKNRLGCSDAERIALDNLFRTYGNYDETKLQHNLREQVNGKKLECETTVWIMENIVSPLLGEGGQCLLNTSHDIPVKNLQKEGKGKQLYVVKGLGIGHKEAWFGEPDAMVGPNKYGNSAGKVAVIGHSVVQASSDEGDVEMEEDDASDGGDSPGNNVMIEGERRDASTTIEGRHYSQAIATAISFSFTYGELHKTLSSLIPTMQISPDAFTVFMYDCVGDYLIGAIFRWTRESLIYLWSVLHYRLFQTRTQLDELVGQCSGYGIESERKNGFTRLHDFMYKANIHKLASKEHTRDMRIVVYAYDESLPNKNASSETQGRSDGAGKNGGAIQM